LNILPALDLRARNDFDDFSCNMGSLSLTLKDLKLTLTSVEMDFLFPLDEDGAPTPRALSLHWPYMESLTLTALPMCLPSGMITLILLSLLPSHAIRCLSYCHF
jgi:hypothetical protein